MIEWRAPAERENRTRIDRPWLQDLRDNPGRWGIVDSLTMDRPNAHMLLSSRHKAWLDRNYPGQFEVTIRREGDEAKCFVRYVGDGS